MLSRRYQLLLLALVLLAVYYPTNFAEVSSLDDSEMIVWLHGLDNWSLRDLFFPSAANGNYYYRPLLMLTYFLDKEVWSLNASIMQLENVLLHLVNSLLVFAFARNLLPEVERPTSFAPLVAALCFALHPLAVEPVGWISGRTDVFAGMFILMSAVALLKYKLEHNFFYVFVALVALVCGTLSKEVAVGFVPGAFLLLIAKQKGQHEPTTANEIFWARFKKIGGFLLLAGGMSLVFFGLRSLAYTSSSSRISMTLQFMFNDLYHALFVFLRAFGFYLKKLYWPFPLNLAIIEIDPLYELLAIPLVLLCFWIASRRTLGSATFIAGIFLIMPALPIAFNQIAWTPYAERYVYIASAFIAIASVFYLRERLNNCHYPLLIKSGIFLFLVFMGAATFQRNMVMQTNLTRYMDMVKKSPDFNVAWNELGEAYRLKNDLKNAEISFRKASSIYSFSYNEKFDLNLAEVLSDQGKYDEAADVYAKIFKKGEKSPRALKHYEEFLQKQRNKPATEFKCASLDPT